jgi:hypothetical protein
MQNAVCNFVVEKTLVSYSAFSLLVPDFIGFIMTFVIIGMELQGVTV